jgi:hypothetical protein
MSDHLTPETAERLRSLSERITIARGLDDDIRAELAAHMEDKLLAYLSGAEKLTEEDAFVLVREHFGNADNLKKLLKKVHAPERCIAYAGRFAGLPIARI